MTRDTCSRDCFSISVPSRAFCMSMMAVTCVGADANALMGI
jgi:hypothetical protein